MQICCLPLDEDLRIETFGPPLRSSLCMLRKNSIKPLLSHCIASFILGFENWNRDDFKALLKLVKSFVLLIWETRKKELYGDQDCVVSGCSCSCPLTGGLTSSACVCGCVVNGVSATAAT